MINKLDKPVDIIYMDPPYPGTMNKYDYPCHQNIEAKKLIFSNFKEFLKKSKYFTKKYADMIHIK